MQIPAKRGPDVAGLSAEDHRDGHYNDGLMIVINDFDREAVQPVVVFLECFAYLNVCFVFRLNSENLYWLRRPGLPDYNPIWLLTIGAAIS